jgi:hypothetical protein
VKKKNQSQAKESEKKSKEFPWSELDAMLQFDPSKRYCADYLRISEDTIERHIRAQFDMTFTEYKALKFDGTVWQIKRAVVTKAINGNIEAAKFVLSNKSDWQEKKEISVEDVTDRELLEAVKSIVEKNKDVVG